MSRYVLSPAAKADLDGIWDYTVRHWGEPQAERYAQMIRAGCEALASGVRLGRDASAIRAGYRTLPVGSHLLFYRVVPSGEIEIVRILHQSMDVSARLSEG